jgi:endogenous inhibitor of DNA gyrase (YacG/DUF329 family)
MRCRLRCLQIVIQGWQKGSYAVVSRQSPSPSIRPLAWEGDSCD